MSIMEDTSEGTTSSPASVSKEDTQNTIGDSTIDSDDEPLTSIKIKAEFQCGHCTKSFKVSRQLRAHARTHEQAFKCEHCPKKFPKATLLALHEQKHDVEKLFNCELCSLSFSSTSQLKKHATTMHATAMHKGVGKKKESNSVDKKPYKCADCHRIFTTFSLLKTHTFSHTRPFKCDICEKTFTRANHLQAHKFTHQSVKPYKCKLCPKSCCTTSHLKKHMLTHTNPQTFKCEMCFSVFTQGHYLKRHMMRHQQKIDREKKREELKQRGEVDDEDKLCTTLEPRKKNKVDKSTRKPHKCHVCGKAFRTPSVLKRHSYCHTGQRPYQCDYCGKGCTTPGNLVAHKRTHNKDRPILCDICGQDFTDIAQLRKHTKTHPEIQTAPDPPASNPIPVVTRPPQGQQVDVIPGNPGIVAPPGVVAPLIDCSTNHPSVVNVTQLHATPLQPTVIQMPVPQIPTDSKSSVNNLNTLGNFNFIGALGNPVAAPLGNIPPPPPPATHNPTEQDRVTTIWRDCYQQSNYMWGGIPGMDPNYQQNLWGGIPAVPIATVNDSRYQSSIVDCRMPDENSLVNKDHLVDVTAQQFDPRDKAMTQINDVVGSIIMKADGETRLATEYNTMQPLSLNPPLATPISTSMPLTHPTPGIHHTIGHTHQQPLPVEQLSAVTVEQNTSMPQSLIGVTTDANIIHHQTAVPQTLLSTDHGLHPVSGHNSLQTSNQAHLQTAGNPSHLQTTHLNILHTSNQVSSNQASLQSNNLHTVADHSDLQTIEHHVLQPVSQLDITNQMQMGQLVHESTPVLLTGPAPPAAEIITTQIQQLPTTPTIVLTQPSSTVATATLPSSAVLKDEQVGEVLPKLETSEDVVEADEVDSDATDINSDRENPVVKLDEETDSDCSDILEQYTEEQEAMFKFECKVCGKRYPTQGQLMTHGYTHTRPFHCNLCEKSFTRASRLQAHRFLHEVKKALQCKFCPRECKTAAMLKKHMKKHNSLMKKNNIIESDSETDIEQFTESEAEDESENVTEVEKKINPFKCEMCPKRFPRASLLKAHVHTHTRPFKCDQCEKTFSRSGHLRVHRYTHLAVRPHKCKHCPKSFTTASHMRQHALSHTGGVPLDDDQPKMKLHSDGELYPKGTVFKCEMCEKTFQSYQFLKIHTWSHTRPFKCDQCQRDFTRPYHLKAHKFTHSEVKPFTCDYCGKSFCTTSHFKKHMLTHTNPQTFNCNMCSSTFTQEHYLKRHKLRHMDKLKKEKYRSENKKTGKFDDDEKACLSLQPKKKAKESNPQKHRHQCTVCGKGFVTPSVLQRHMYSHTGQRPFVCDFCGKGCSTTGNLAAHKRTHTKDRTFLCDVCGKDYSEMAALRKHARTHLEEKQYQCDMCPQSFVQPFHLKSHKMIHMQMY